MSIHAPKVILIGGWHTADGRKSRPIRYVRQDDDGRPCAMEAFVAALLAAGLDAPVIKGAISAWIKGNWQAALLPLSDDARARLKGEGGAA
ncbi:hypothetical protein [Martelella sp. FOR1707]